MPRVKRGTQANARRKRLLKHTKGFMWTRKSKFRQAKEATLHAWSFQFADRKKKKRDFRRLWQVRMNALLKEMGTSHSRFIPMLKKANIALDRKILAELAMNHPETFKKIVESVK